MQCRQCGGVTVYADDSTFTISDKDPNILSDKLSRKFEVMADFLTANKLKVNSDKTHLVVMCTDQRRRNIVTNVRITTTNEIIEASEAERLLGAYIHQNMKWTEHIQTNENSLIYGLNQRLGALKRISRYASFKARLTIANGIFMSKLGFMIPLWSGCQEYLIRALQTIQNKVARVVTKHDRRVPVKQILKECGWRSEKQEMFFQTVMQVHKVLMQTNPVYLYRKLIADGSYSYRTRSSSTSSIRQSISFKTGLTLCKESFRWRGVTCYEELPWEVRKCEKIDSFKQKADTWIRENVR